VNRARIAVVALIGLTGLAGCTVPTGLLGLFGSAGRTVPTGTLMCGPCGPHPDRPTRSHRALVLDGAGALTDNANDSYVAWGEMSVSGTESDVEIPVPVGGTLSNLRVLVDTAPRTVAGWTLTVDRNESATALSCSIAGLATSCGDWSVVAVVVGDKLDLRVKPFGTPELAKTTWSVTITP